MIDRAFALNGVEVFDPDDDCGICGVESCRHGALHPWTRINQVDAVKNHLPAALTASPALDVGLREADARAIGGYLDDLDAGRATAADTFEAIGKYVIATLAPIEAEEK